MTTIGKSQQLVNQATPFPDHEFPKDVPQDHFATEYESVCPEFVDAPV